MLDYLNQKQLHGQYQQNPLQYNGDLLSQISLHPSYSQQYQLDEQKVQILLVGNPQLQLVHQLYPGPVHSLHDLWQISLDKQIFLSETNPVFVFVDVNKIQPEVGIVVNKIVKFTVLTSQGRASQNPVVIEQVVGEVQEYEYVNDSNVNQTV
ncbi:unnamed protein product [Paramecium sonneborni]|uniref:Uncharacterized protein n=1 Tax=Paramecium sonneborni TaxID=65129 RepID=A0A8S1QT91_9CILI|nr:unnamed protein product [Paramecium sonneborni]